MIFVLQGRDQFLLTRERNDLLKKYKEDDFNYSEFISNIDIGEFTSSLQQVPMLAEYYVVYAKVNKKQWIRLKEYFKPTKFVVLIIELEDFNLNPELAEGMPEYKSVDCSMPKGRELLKWIGVRASKYGVNLDKDDRKYISLLFSSLKEIDDILYQMSFLSDFDKQIFMKDQFNSKQRFVWDLFVALVTAKKRDFFSKYAEQAKQNLGLSASQFNMKTIGGLLYCLNNHEEAPYWVRDKLTIFESNLKVYYPYIYCELIKLLTIAKMEKDSVFVIDGFVKVLNNIKV